MNEIKFIEESHQYFIDDVELVPVSSVISSFFPEFEKEKAAKHYAAKYNLNVDRVINSWEKIGKRARDFGTTIHKYAEDRINGKDVKETESGRETVYRKAVDEYLKDYGIHILKSELVVGNKEMEIGGTIDIVGDTFLGDFKTSRQIYYTNQYGEKSYVLTDYPNCNYVKYSLQLSLYKILYDSDKDLDLQIVHLMPNRYEIHDAIDFSEKLKELGFSK